jgi:3-oxosteroid 1-dehydrogenase
LGSDSQFHRGEAPYGRFWGDPDNQPGPNLGTLEKGPFYAVPMLPSNIGTCGGPRIDANGRVLREDGSCVPGLFAAGNATAAISGPAYFGPGGTIGPAIVFGVLAGRTAARKGG